MAKAKKIGDLDPDAVIKKVVKPTPTVGGIAEAYQVESEGYSETFTTREAAIKQAEILKKRAIKNQEPVKISVKEIETGGKGKQVHQIKIGEEFYK